MNMRSQNLILCQQLALQFQQHASHISEPSFHGRITSIQDVPKKNLNNFNNNNKHLLKYNLLKTINIFQFQTMTAT